jgi:hypothetical protein
MDWANIEDIIERSDDPRELLVAAEASVENWLAARAQAPRGARKEGFRLLALHAQGAKGDPSFNACRETCREACYHVNLLEGAALPASEKSQALAMLRLVVRHLMLFIRGKLEVAGLGEFCCAAKPIRAKDHATYASHARS